MKEETAKKEVKVINKYQGCGGGGAGGAIYFFGFIGVLVYYLQRSATFNEGLLGVLKAIGWPGVIVYRIFELLNL